MPSDPNKFELAATYQALMETLKLDDALKEQSINKTIVPTDRHRSFADPKQVISVLPKLSTDMLEGDLPQLTLREIIGQGGMGAVYAAQQNALGRTVAVKSLREDADVSSGKLRSILQEAWLTGYLEHPNIIPIYTLGCDAKGSPMIVMKRVEGTPWCDYIHKPDKLAHKTQANITLEWHLEILIQVCRAMEYAHSRGILHRDLKPENIMIGGFGEVYVLDWGIAVSMREALDGRLPLLSEATLLAGTPPYMAPEMTTGQGPIDERTDVYLLGAILHELMTQRPPHDGNSVQAVMLQAFVSAIKPYPAHLPKELTQIAQRAMHREPNQRYQDVRALRLALTSYLEHRASLTLTRQAQHSLEALTKLIKAPQRSDEDARELVEHFGQCRFGFQQALHQWPQNQDAREGFYESLLLMIEHELTQGHITSAQALLHELDPPPPHMLEAIEALRQRAKDHQAHVANLELIVRDMDTSVGQRSRSYMAIVFAIAWTALPMITGAMEDLGYTTLTHQGYVIGAVRVFAIAAIVCFLFRKTLLSNEINRRLTVGLLGMTLLLILLRGVFWLNHIQLTHMLSVEVVFYALFVFMLGMIFSLQFSAVSIIYVVGAILMSVFPHVDDYIGGLCNLGVLLSIGYIWKKQPTSKTSKTSKEQPVL